MTPRLLIGVSGAGGGTPADPNPDIETRFRMVRESGVFDYYDRTPPPAEIDLWKRASQIHGVPLKAGGFYYRLGRDEDLLFWHLRLAADLGAIVHNVQIFTHDIKGAPVSNGQVADLYLKAAEIGARMGVRPCFEVHINMWSEHFGRVAEVARLVESKGIPFYMTFDISHVIFKIGNARELAVQGLDADVESGKVILDPTARGSVSDIWLDAGWVGHAHARPVVPNNPRNIWARHPDGEPGRGVQYPFVRPAPGQWHSDWEESRLETWKAAMRRLLARHSEGRFGPVLTISTEIIPSVDYGQGARYSLFEDNIAVASWLRDEWSGILARRGCPAASLQQ